MADDPCIGHQPLHVVLVERRHLLEIEVSEGGPEVLPLAQDRQPRQPRLKAFEADLFEQPEVIGHRPPPLLVMVAAIVVEPSMPEAPRTAVFADDDARLLHCRPLLMRRVLDSVLVNHVPKPAGNPAESFMPRAVFESPPVYTSLVLHWQRDLQRAETALLVHV